MNWIFEMYQHIQGSSISHEELSSFTYPSICPRTCLPSPVSFIFHISSTWKDSFLDFVSVVVAAVIVVVIV